MDSSFGAFKPDTPHDLPRLPPSTDVETRQILRACIKARSALAAMDQATRRIPNPAVLINTLPLLEAADSSRIENIVTTTDELFRHASSDLLSGDPATREALRYRTALHEGFQSLSTRPLSTATAVTVCRTIKGADMEIRRVPGTQIVRRDTGEAVYTPPVGEIVLRDLLGDWERFLHNTSDIDPLIRMAIGHYQFEAIHPFTDGNGRTGRILNLLYLVDAGILHLPVLYLSRYIIEHKADYYRLLIEVTRSGTWEPWILFMLDAVRDTADWTLEKVNTIGDLQRATIEHVRNKLPRLYRYELVELLFNQPYCRINHVVDAGIAGRQAAARSLAKLTAIGVLDEQRLNGRERLFINTRLMTLLTTDAPRFAEF
ncbi:Fic family protein [Granulosicoccus sp.]|nr:Fic family protein [Granulosicoccus sp.]